MAARIPTLLLGALLLASTTAGAEPDPSKKPQFVYPEFGSSHVYNMLDTVMVTYTSFDETAELWTFCDPGAARMIYRQKTPGFNTSVPVLLNFTSSTPCWFNIRTTDDGENSATWNLLGEERAQGRRVFGPGEDVASSSTVSSATSSSTAGSASSTAVFPSTTAVGNPSSTSSGSPAVGGGGGLSAGASAGIGVGAALGVIAVAGAVFFVFWRRRRQQKYAAAGQMSEVPEIGGGDGGGGGGGGGYEYSGQYNKWQFGGEMDAVNNPVEVGNSNLQARPGQIGRPHHEMAA